MLCSPSETKFLDWPHNLGPHTSSILGHPSLLAWPARIGGDTDSTEGSESSHMHSSDDLDCTRGYEFWLASQAKLRNPHIRICERPIHAVLPLSLLVLLLRSWAWQLSLPRWCRLSANPATLS